MQPGDMNIAGLRFHGLQGNPKRWSVRVTGNLSDHVRDGADENAVDIDLEDYHSEKEVMERKNGLPPVHPGEILKEDILPSVDPP